MVWQWTISSVLLQVFSERQHPRAAARVGVEAHQLVLTFWWRRICELGKIFEIILADWMFDRHFCERVRVNESAQDELQFADDGCGLERVAGSRVARYVGEEDLLASGEQRFEEA